MQFLRRQASFFTNLALGRPRVSLSRGACGYSSTAVVRDAHRVSPFRTVAPFDRRHSRAAMSVRTFARDLLDSISRDPLANIRKRRILSRWARPLMRHSVNEAWT